MTTCFKCGCEQAEENIGGHVIYEGHDTNGDYPPEPAWFCWECLSQIMPPELLKKYQTRNPKTKQQK